MYVPAYRYVQMSVGTMEARGIGILRAGVMDSYELPDMVAKNQFSSSERKASALTNELSL